MKTTTKPANRFRRPVSAIVSGLCPLLAAYTLVSCGTGPSTKPAAGPVALQPAHWFKAKNDPPTYFPKGVPVDHPTTCNDGSWVMTGDPAGTRYFIPVRGVDSRSLTAEAMTTMTPERREKLKKGGAPDVNLAEGIGKMATGIGSLIVELDQHATAERNRQDLGPSRGTAGLWEKTERR